MEAVSSVEMIDVSDPSTQTVVGSESLSSDYAAEDFRRNSGSYRKRKAKKQVDAETTVEDLRGKSHDASLKCVITGQAILKSAMCICRECREIFST